MKTKDTYSKLLELMDYATNGNWTMAVDDFIRLNISPAELNSFSDTLTEEGTQQLALIIFYAYNKIKQRNYDAN